MNSQQHIHILRVQLLAMSRLSQRALDDSIKGYGMRNLDFSRHARTAHREIEEHHRRIQELCRELLDDGFTKTADSRYAFAALNIESALHATYTAAVDIARDTVRQLESGSMQRSEDLENMAHLVNGAMRLCTVALFEKDACHAESVLRHLESVELRGLASVDSRSHGSRQQGSFECDVTRSLGEVAKQVREMADAILFLLGGNSSIAVSAGDKPMAEGLPSARHVKDAATLSYMQSERVSGSKTTQPFSC